MYYVCINLFHLIFLVSLNSVVFAIQISAPFSLYAKPSLLVIVTA